jgi:hypothetical protein
LTVHPSATLFHPLENVPGVRAAFVPRIPGVDVATDRDEALARLAGPHADCLAAQGFAADRLATAEQVHGAGVVAVTVPGRQPQTDGLMKSGATPPGIDPAHQKVRSVAAVLPRSAAFADACKEDLTVRPGIKQTSV